MERSKNYVVFGILALIVSLVAVSLAYAGFTQNLNINGTANIKSVKWEVKFVNLSNEIATGTATELTAPTIKSGSTSIGDYSVQLSSPGDTIAYTFDVINSGNFKAKLTGLTIDTPSCSSTNQSNANAVCDYITYKLYDTTTNTEIAAADNGVINANGGVRHFKIILSYANNIPASSLPTADISVTGLGLTFTYTQDGNAVIS
jgi:hypothetical protein